MATTKHSPRPRGRQPWDPANGLRVGTLTGGLIGAAVVALTGLSSFWIIAGCGVIGGAVGFWSEKRKVGHGAARRGGRRHHR